MASQRQYEDIKAGLGKGVADDQIFQSLLGVLVMPGTRAWWAENKYWLSSEFHQAVDVKLTDDEEKIIPWSDIMPLWKASDRELEIIIADEDVRLKTPSVQSASAASNEE